MSDGLIENGVGSKGEVRDGRGKTIYGEIKSLAKCEVNYIFWKVIDGLAKKPSKCQ